MKNEHKKSTEEEITLTMQSTEGMQRAKANPFLYEKVMARINTQINSQSNTQNIPSEEPGWNFTLNIKYALVIIAFIILNVVTIAQFTGENSTKINTSGTKTTQEDSKTKFAEEYFYNSSNSYGY